MHRLSPWIRWKVERMETNLPKRFLEQMQKLLGTQYESYIKSLTQPAACGLRVNTLKLSPEEFRSRTTMPVEPVPWISDGFFYEESEQPSKDPYYAAGLYYLQEPSAMTPADRLPVEPGDRVLDLCAAPGGKATKLGVRLQGKGILFANDISSSRAKALLKNLELFGIRNICVMSEDPAKLLAIYPEYFDKILIDAPCSGEGMFRKASRMTADWERRGPGEYAVIQRELLGQAYQMLKPGGMMLYSTCTFSKEENENKVEWLLREFPDLELAQIAPYEGFSEGCGDLLPCVRIFPHRMRGEGHFLALLKKQGELSENSPGKAGTCILPKEAEAFFQDVSEECLEDMELRVIGERLYALSRGCELEPSIRYLRTGWYLGDIKKGRFEPSQAFAMGIKPSMYRRVLSLPHDDYRIIKYLKGETLDVAGLACESGWHLVCVDEFPLGWSKIQKNTLKNKYYSGWRWQ